VIVWPAVHGAAGVTVKFCRLTPRTVIPFVA
jgi:hypothetical protein